MLIALSLLAAAAPPQRIAYVRAEGKDNTSLWVVPIKGGAPRRIASNLGWIGNPQWSPNGQWLAFEGAPKYGEQADLFAWKADGTALRRLTKSARYDSLERWSDDGTRIISYWRSRPYRFATVDLNGHEHL